jgi:hypothetical protein
MHLRTITWLLLLSLNVAFGEQKQSRRCMVATGAMSWTRSRSGIRR